MSRISYVCTWVTSCNSSYFFVKPCFSQEGQNVIYFDVFEQISLTIHFENCILITAKALHSIRICLTVQDVWQVKHCDCCPCFNMKVWVNLEWPMRNRDIMTCSLLDFLKAGLHSPKLGWIWKSLLWMFMSHRCCHFVWKNLLIVGFKSVYGMEITSGLRPKADLAAESALSFPLTPMWLGIQHKIIFLWLGMCLVYWAV